MHRPSAARGTQRLVAGLALLLICAACSSTHHASTPPASTPPATTSPPTSAPATTAAATTTSAPVSSTPAAAQPVLGALTGDFAHGRGYGQVRPSQIFNGGDPTGLVTQVVWQSWGSARASALGTSDYVAPGQSTASGSQELATVVAFNLGTCGGVLMYQAVEWYFPQHGQTFSATVYQNICTGTYVGQ